MDGSVSARYPENRSTDDLLSEGWARLPATYRIPPKAPDIAEARAYCARLARGHYENFSVASWFLPKRLHRPLATPGFRWRCWSAGKKNCAPCIAG